MDQQTYFEVHLASTISPMEYFMSKNEDMLLVDVRNGPTHVRGSKIEGALELPQAELADRLSEIPSYKRIVVYCWDSWCNLGKKAAVTLLENGYQVKEMTGGFAAWNTLRLPTVSLTSEY